MPSASLVSPSAAVSLASGSATATPAPGASIARLRPARAIVSVWAVTLLLSLYGADEVALSVRTSTRWGEDPRALALVAALTQAGRATGLAALRRALEGEGGTLPPKGSPHTDGLATVALAPTPPAPAPTPAGSAPAPSKAIARVLLVGASSIQFHLGIELERVLSSAYSGLTVLRLGKLSTGLTRPDVFDWPARLRELCASFHPDLIVANFGGNDAQGMVLGEGRIARFGDPDWDRTYGVRLQEVVKIGRGAGAQVVLLGMSTTRDPVLSGRMARVNELTEEAARAAGATYLSIWDLGADSRGRYQEIATVGGRAIKTRLADGKHFSRVGAAHVATEIARRLAAIHPLTPARDPDPRRY